jgi:cyclophilin family peptidyl-prolyl cis-trans isomerase
MAKQYSSPPPMSIDTEKAITAVMHTSKGDITFELFASETPNTVNNFVFLAQDGYYSNVIFHRIIKGFMIQGGDPTGTGSGGPGYSFNDEPVTRDYVAGTLAMANSGPNTNGSQFFIMHGNNPLPKNYTIFGQVIDGISVVNELADTPVTVGAMGESSSPVEPPVINSVDVNIEP